MAQLMTQFPLATRHEKSSAPPEQLRRGEQIHRRPRSVATTRREIVDVDHHAVTCIHHW
jgi:hypothetical protein